MNRPRQQKGAAKRGERWHTVTIGGSIALIVIGATSLRFRHTWKPAIVDSIDARWVILMIAGSDSGIIALVFLVRRADGSD